MRELITFYISIFILIAFLLIITPALFSSSESEIYFSLLIKNPLSFLKRFKDFYYEKVLKKAIKSKFSPLFCLLFSFFISFFFYILFAFPLTKTNINLYQPDLSLNDKKDLQALGRSFISNWNTTFVFIVVCLISLFLLLYLLYLKKNKRLNFKNGLFFIFSFAIIIRLFYMVYTDNIFTRQYDVWSLNYNGHFSITMHIFKNNRIPDLLLDRTGTPSLKDSYQFYHPKFAHYTYAYFMHFMSLFLGQNTFELYESIRILTTTLSILELFIGYKILKELFTNEKGVFFASLLFFFFPLLIRLGAMSNNDPMLWFFIYLSIYLTIKFFKEEKINTIIALAISIGLAMASKISGAMIAFPVAIVFIYKFIISFKNKTTLKLIFKYLVFLLLACPIGLYWPIFNMINYNQPLNYVWDNLNHHLLVDTSHSYLSRFFFLPVSEFFKSPFMQLWANYKEIAQDYNIYVAMAKSSIFGEFSYLDNIVFSLLLYVSNLVLLTSFILLSGYLLIISFIKRKEIRCASLFLSFIFLYYSIVFILAKNKIYLIIGILFILLTLFFIFLIFKSKEKTNLKPEFFILSIVITFMISFLAFNIKMPYACTMDFRYLAPLYLGGSLLIITFNTKLKENNKFESKILNIINWISIIFSASSFLFFLTIPF